MDTRRLMLLCGLLAPTGCADAGPSPAEPETTVVTAAEAAPSVVAVRPATTEMIDAAVKGQPLPADAERVEACHGTSVCPPEFGACTNWSPVSTCGTTTEACSCTQCTGAGCFIGNLKTTTTERYRVCFTDTREPCTEYQNSNSVLCSLVPKCE